MEQQTPIPPKSRMKPREGQKRAIFPSLIWGGGGGGWRGGLGFPFILSKIVATVASVVRFYKQPALITKLYLISSDYVQFNFFQHSMSISLSCYNWQGFYMSHSKHNFCKKLPNKLSLNFT